MANDIRLEWMTEQIKLEANAIRNQISGLPEEVRDKLRENVIGIIRDEQKGDKNEH